MIIPLLLYNFICGDGQTDRRMMDNPTTLGHLEPNYTSLVSGRRGIDNSANRYKHAFK